MPDAYLATSAARHDVRPARAALYVVPAAGLGNHAEDAFGDHAAGAFAVVGPVDYLPRHAASAPYGARHALPESDDAAMRRPLPRFGA